MTNTMPNMITERAGEDKMISGGIYQQLWLVDSIENEICSQTHIYSFPDNFQARKMTAPIIIFDASDEVVFDEDPDIHFQIYRLLETQLNQEIKKNEENIFQKLFGDASCSEDFEYSEEKHENMENPSRFLKDALKDS